MSSGSVDATTRRVLYPVSRAVEHAVAQPGVRPMRLFPVLWPLRQVEISAFIADEQAYEVIDHFLVRGIAEGHLTRIRDLAWFLTLPEPLVRRCLEFLRTIGHVQIDGDHLRLTDLGVRSWRAEVRYEAKESRQQLLFDHWTAAPLPRAYYGGATVLSSGDVSDDQRPLGVHRFRRLFDPTPWQPVAAVQMLAARSDRADYNVPTILGDLQVLDVQDAFLPMYLIETATHGVLVYTMLAEEPDAFFTGVVARIGDVGERMRAEQLGDPRRIWTDWLASRSLGRGLPKEEPDGRWRILLPATSFGPDPGQLSIVRLGSYELRHHHFAQLWCDDDELRGRAVLERALGMTHSRGVETIDDLLRRVGPVARTLQVAAPSLAQLREFAVRHQRTREAARLDTLAGID